MKQNRFVKKKKKPARPCGCANNVLLLPTLHQEGKTRQPPTAHGLNYNLGVGGRQLRRWGVKPTNILLIWGSSLSWV